MLRMYDFKTCGCIYDKIMKNDFFGWIKDPFFLLAVKRKHELFTPIGTEEYDLV